MYRCKLTGSLGFEKIIVLKILLEQAAQDKETVENFIDEARLAALLQHENIAHIYDFGKIEGSYFIAMEYLFGKDLYSIVQKAKEADTPIDLETALLIAGEVCEGMEYAHTLNDIQQRPLNIIHRDLTPHNVFVTHDGKVKIIDFGIAKAELFDNKTRVGIIKGKVSYMSPEQLSEKSIDNRSDIFSIGILLYEMISGKRMYVGDTATIIRKCLQVDYENLRTIMPGLPERVYTIVEKALQLDRKKRYQTCRQMHDEISECLFDIRKPSKTLILKDYMASLFGADCQKEKDTLFTAASHFDTIDNKGNADKTQITSYWDATTRQSVFPDSTHNLNILVDTVKESSQENSGNHQNKSLTPYKKTFLGLFGMISLILAIHFGFNNETLELTQQEPQILEQEKKLDQAEELKDKSHKSSEEKRQKNDEETQQERIDSFLAKAKTEIATAKSSPAALTTAEGYYREVLALSPENKGAQDGLYIVTEKYAEFAEKLLQNKNYSDAEKNISKGLQVEPDNGRLLALAYLIQQEKIRVIEQLAWKAKQSLARNQLTTPVDNCAYNYYLEILKLDSKNKVGLNGLQSIGDRYSMLADEAYRSLDIEKAREFVEKGLQVAPKHKRLLELKKDLSRSGPGLFFRAIRKNLDSAVK